MQLRSLLRGEMAFFAAAPLIMWQILFVVVPLSISVGFSIWDAAHGSFTLQNYAALIDWVHFRIIARSMLASLGTATSCLFIAYPVAYFLVVRAGAWRGPLLFLSMVPFWTNFLVQVYAWFFLLERDGLINVVLSWFGLGPFNFINTIASVIIVMIYCYLPFMIISLYVALERLDLRLLEASADLGANAWQTFTRITVPLSLPGVKSGLILVLVASFGEFAIPSLMGGSRFMFVGSLISYFSLSAREHGLSAAFTIISSAVLIMMVCAILFFLRFLYRPQPHVRDIV